MNNKKNDRMIFVCKADKYTFVPKSSYASEKGVGQLKCLFHNFFRFRKVYKRGVKKPISYFYNNKYFIPEESCQNICTCPAWHFNFIFFSVGICAD